MKPSTSLSTNAPIGVFDSGVGGLSILQALRHHMPAENFVYVSDSAHAPYGERDSAFVLERARQVLNFLQKQHGIKALVVACNTATALAIQALRNDAPNLPILGVEPAIKPAALLSKTKRVGVMATPATLQSEKFQKLMQSLTSDVEFVLQGCEGLANAIEMQWQQPDNKLVTSLCTKYLGAMGEFGSGAGQIDVLVLGCTHYPFATPVLRALVGPGIAILETGDPVAKQTLKVLVERGLLSTDGVGDIKLVATGDTNSLHHASMMWLSLNTQVESLKAEALVTK